MTVLGLALFSLPVWASAPEILPPELADRVDLAHSLSMADRLEFHTRPWLGLPYTEGPLGEGEGYDPDPLVRYDTFDCLTLVEEALALSMATSHEEVQRIRLGLRYRNGGPVTYENRRHFMLAEWIPGNVSEGWLQDLTPQLPGAVQFNREVSLSVWSSWRRRALFPLPDERLPTGEQIFWYLPLDAALSAIHEIPPGSVVFTLRQPLAHLPISITHVSLTIPGEQPTMRHATKMGEGLVRDDSLQWYLEHLQTYTNWPVAGIIVLAPIEGGQNP